MIAVLCMSWSITATAAGGYAVLMPDSLSKDKEWSDVAQALVTKYSDAEIYRYGDNVGELRDALAKDRPHYLALVLPPQMVGAQTVADMHRLSRKLDDDPYGDALWGIITGYSASDAMRIVRTEKPLVIKSGFGTTGFKASHIDNVMNISDAKRGEVYLKENGGKGETTQYDASSPEGLVQPVLKFWREKKPELFVTSGHATQYNLELSWGQGLITCSSNRFYALRHDQLNGFARFLGGVIFKGREQDVADYVKKCKAPAFTVEKGPKVWVGAGNCLLGDARHSKNTMVITALSAGGFNQLVGYVVTTWFGRMGWGTLGMFQNAQHPTLAEAFFFNNQKLLAESKEKYPGLLKMRVDPSENFFHDIKTPMFSMMAKRAGVPRLDKEALGLLHDRDSVAFFGDPRWEARMPGAPALKVVRRKFDKGIELNITTTDDFKAGKGFAVVFDKPLADPQLKGADAWKYVLTDDFLLVLESRLEPSDSASVRIIAGSR